MPPSNSALTDEPAERLSEKGKEQKGAIRFYLSTRTRSVKSLSNKATIWKNKQRKTRRSSVVALQDMQVKHTTTMTLHLG